MDLSCNSMEEMIVPPDSRTNVQQKVQCKTDEVVPSSSQIETTITTSKIPTNPTNPTTPRDQINTSQFNSEPPPIKKKGKKKKKKKGGYQSIMNSILASQETDSQKQQNHLNTISNQMGHGVFSKIDKI